LVPPADNVTGPIIVSHDTPFLVNTYESPTLQIPFIPLVVPVFSTGYPEPAQQLEGALIVPLTFPSTDRFAIPGKFIVIELAA
jgi:hypothetical protein